MSNKLAADARLQALARDALRSGAERPSGQRERSAEFYPRVFLRNQMRYAAALMFGVGIALYFATFQPISNDDFAPAVGYANSDITKRRIELEDGSVVQLDVDSSITVELTPKERRVELNKGRAFFEVAHDSARPFTVSASATQVVALGTAFQVELLPQRQTVSVTLAEGSVAVSDNRKRSSWREVLVPGQQLQFDEVSRRHTKAKVDAERVTSWSGGRLVFDGTPLEQALNEINRYSRTKIVLGDAALAKIPIGGNFLAGGDNQEFVETLSAVLPLRSIRTGANEIVLFQRHTSPP